MKKAVLIMAYGSPQKEEDVEPYYTHIRHGRRPSEEELGNLKERYRAIGGRSPLGEITESTAGRLEDRLSQVAGEDVPVFAAMKHWHPFIHEVFKERIIPLGVSDLLAITLAPHFSKMSIGSYQDAVREAKKSVNVRFVDRWYDNPVFIKKWAERIRTNMASLDGDVFLLFSAHSLPEKILSYGDPYKEELLKSTDLIAGEIPTDKYGFAFQSAGHTSEPWLGPDVLDKLSELSREGWREVLDAPIGFVSDHLEILYDLDIEAKEEARSLGIRFERTESFNDSSDFIDVLQSVVLNSKFLP